jgi:hypothetical protein
MRTVHNFVAMLAVAAKSLQDKTVGQQCVWGQDMSITQINCIVKAIKEEKVSK